MFLDTLCPNTNLNSSVFTTESCTCHILANITDILKTVKKYGSY